MTSRKRRRIGLAAAAIGAALALTGCGAGSEPGDSAAPQAGPGERGNAGAPDKQQDPPPGAGAGTPARLRLDARSIIYTGEITVRVTDVNRAAAQATELATGAGGFVGSDKRSIDDSRSEAHLTLRVPAEKFTPTVDGLARLGTEQGRAMGTEDVTEAVVDLDARIQSQRASVARTRALLAQAGSLAEIVSVEAELAKRESELAALEARKRRLADLTALSTVTAHLLGPQAEAVTPKERELGFATGLRSGWNAFVTAMNIGMTVLGFLLPPLVPVLLVIALVWLLRRRRPARLSPPPPAGPPGTPAP